MSHTSKYPPDGGYPTSTNTAGYPAAGALTQGWFAVSDPGYIKGALLGAGLTYILTNQKVQRALVKGVVTVWTAVQGGIEEVKEQIHDVKAEMSMKGDADKT
ncbi:YtxH domain-containing protein [Desulfolutivibrio sp.]|uniref:YtxH domain-containing protein n=1 Tax=Desulfolutivibrio sp. TaxID=2773296 RepID=UPI002F969576